MIISITQDFSLVVYICVDGRADSKIEASTEDAAVPALSLGFNTEATDVAVGETTVDVGIIIQHFKAPAGKQCGTNTSPNEVSVTRSCYAQKGF